MNKIIQLDHDHIKIDSNLIIFDLKVDKEKDMLALVKEKIQEKIQIETTCLIEAK